MAISRDDIELSKKQAEIHSNEISKEISQINKKSRKEKFIKGAKYIGSHGGNILSILIIILIGVSMIRILYYGSLDTVSIGSFLDILSDAPQVSTKIKTFVQSIAIPGPWLVLDEFRIVLNSFIDVFSILIWICSSIVDVIIFITYFLLWIFI